NLLHYCSEGQEGRTEVYLGRRRPGRPDQRREEKGRSQTRPAVRREASKLTNPERLKLGRWLFFALAMGPSVATAHRPVFCRILLPRLRWRLCYITLPIPVASRTFLSETRSGESNQFVRR